MLKNYKNFKKYQSILFIPSLKKTELFSKEFLTFIEKYESLQDFDRLLLWKILQINSLFRLKYKTQNKQEISYVYFVTEKKRLLIALLWLKIILKTNKKRCNCYEFYTPIGDFISKDLNENKVNLIKLEIYKVKLLELSQ